METDYDEGHVAEQYKQAKEHPWRSRIESYSLMNLLGDLAGKSVVDVACGEGYFTRKIRQAGASKVFGFDVSGRMIELALAQEARDPLGIEYAVEDARTKVPQQAYDVAFSGWLLGYARDRGDLAQMCQGLSRWLRPGGRFVTISINPDVYSFNPVPDYRRYGFELLLEKQAVEGTPIRCTYDLGTTTLTLENYYLPVSAIETAFTNAGFRNFRLHPLQLSPSPDGRDDRADWDLFLRYPVAILIECEKA